jgi:hypothetical protein
MSKYFYCKHCKERKRKNPCLKNKQFYCGAKVCQRASKNKWEREKLKNDPLYYAHRKKQKAKWRKECPADAYQRSYRKSHPDYDKRNCELQPSRNAEAKKRQPEHAVSNIVKTDSLTSGAPVLSGLYAIYPCKTDLGEKIVKTDPLIVELKVHCGIAEGLVPNSGKL